MDTSKVTRFEVIGGPARMLVRYGVSVELSLQDGGRTLKAFLEDLSDGREAQGNLTPAAAGELSRLGQELGLEDIPGDEAVALCKEARHELAAKDGDGLERWFPVYPGAEGGRARVIDAIADRIRGGEDPDAVAEDYGVSREAADAAAATGAPVTSSG
jgi:hypothetical protein